MSLLREIQEGAIDGRSDLPTILRKAKLLAARIKYGPLAAWVDLELGGYRAEASVPSYRKYKGTFVGEFLSQFAQARGVDVDPGHFPDPELARRLLQLTNYQSIGELAELLAGGGQSFYMSVPAGLGALLNGRVYTHMPCVGLKIQISRCQIAQVFESVRNALLAFTIELENIFPELATTDSASIDAKVDQVNQAFHIHIEGSGNAINVGSPSTAQVAG